jgi:hypothetical protein
MCVVEGNLGHSLYKRCIKNRKALVRRAQSRIDQATLENEMGNWDNARSERPIGLQVGAPYVKRCFTTLRDEDRLGQ